MTYTESLIKKGEQRGIQKGIQQAIEEGRQEGVQDTLKRTAEELIKCGIDEFIIEKVTHLTKIQIEEIKKSTKLTAKSRLNLI